MRKLIPAVALLLVVAGLAEACPIARAVVRKRVVVAEVATVVTPLVAVVPSYVGYYAPGTDNSALVNEVKGLRADLKALASPPPLPSVVPAPAQAAARGAFSLEGVMVSTCARCHVEKAAADSGGGQVLVENDGKVSVLSLAEQREVARVIADGSMPPKKPLDDATRAAAKALLPTKRP